MDDRLAKEIEDLISSDKYSTVLDDVIKNKRDFFPIDFNDISPKYQETLQSKYVETVKAGGLNYDIHDEVSRRITLLAKGRGIKDDFDVMVAFKNVIKKKAIKDLTSSDTNGLLEINGIITSTIPPRSVITMGIFLCQKCGEKLVVPQQYSELQRPSECSMCRAKRGFILMETECKWDDYQELYIQENPEDVETKAMPRIMKVRAVGQQMMDVCRPGDVVDITGAMLLEQKGRGGKGLIFDWYIDANYINVLNADAFRAKLTEEDITVIQYWAASPNIRKLIVDSIFPSIYGYQAEKYGLTLGVFGGRDIKKRDIDHRGIVNVLLLGDPSTAKSRMLLAITRAVPKGIYTSGKGASGPGLTAAVIKDDTGWRLAAGPLVLADNGICCIDEIEKMDSADRTRIHDAMATQKIKIDKADVHAMLNARTAILAAANPSQGRYDPYMTLTDNVSLPTTILSRFDLIFIIKDVPDEERDRALMTKILDIESVDDDKLIDVETLKKYILYAKRINPKITKKAKDKIIEFYVKMRQMSDGVTQNPIAITARQGEGIRRLAEASARMRLKDIVDEEDVELAIELMLETLEKAGYDPATGKIDVNILEGGKPKSQADREKLILNTLRGFGEPVPVEDLIEALADYMTQDEVRKELRKMEHTLYKPNPGWIWII